MALRPPSDFSPPPVCTARPSDSELRSLWDRYEARRRDQRRRAEWRRALELVRRDSAKEVVASSSLVRLPSYLTDAATFGQASRDALRPAPRRGRASAAGIDTWSPCWYAAPGTPLARAMRALATRRTRVAHLLPESVLGYRVGWFPESGLVFAEGRPQNSALLEVGLATSAMSRLRVALKDLGLPLAGAHPGGFRRLDIAADLWTDSPSEGLGLLECIASSALGSGKLVSYRSERCVESVLLKTRAGRTRGRLYDKGAETGLVSRGRWLRFEAQWRFPRGSRPTLEQLDVAALRARFWQRFRPLWQASMGFRTGGIAALGDRLQAAVRSGQLLPSRARSIAGYLLLTAAGVSQGAQRTAYELERECRELGLSVSLLEDVDRFVDAASVLEECMALEIWKRS